MSSETIERPDYVPKDWLLMRAPDGCTYWVSPDYKGRSDFFFPCQIAEDETKDESWHSGDDLEEVKEGIE